MINLNLFDRLEEEGLVYPEGDLKKCMGFDVEEVEINTVLRESVLVEDSEFYTVWEDNDRKELIFKLLQLCLVGGRLNQYEDNVEPYKNFVKDMYKELVKYFFF